MVEKSQEPGQGQNSVVDPEAQVNEELAKQQEELKKLEQELEESKYNRSIWLTILNVYRQGGRRRVGRFK